MPTPSLVATGFALNDESFLFDPRCDHTCCRICGAVFQSALDRDDNPLNKLEATLMRREWSFSHARKHSIQEHEQLANSGMWCTPSAAQELVKFGVISVVDLVTSGGMAKAYFDSTPELVRDCEGGE